MPECFVSQFNLNLCTANVYRKCVFCLSLFAPGWPRANDESEPGQVLLENAGKRGGRGGFPHALSRPLPTARRVPPDIPPGALLPSVQPNHFLLATFLIDESPHVRDQGDRPGRGATSPPGESPGSRAQAQNHWGKGLHATR